MSIWSQMQFGFMKITRTSAACPQMFALELGIMFECISNEQEKRSLQVADSS